MTRPIIAVLMLAVFATDLSGQAGKGAPDRRILGKWKAGRATYEFFPDGTFTIGYGPPTGEEDPSPRRDSYRITGPSSFQDSKGNVYKFVFAGANKLQIQSPFVAEANYLERVAPQVASANKRLILGKWYEGGSRNALEFKPNGILAFYEGSQPLDESYSFVNATILKMLFPDSDTPSRRTIISLTTDKLVLSHTQSEPSGEKVYHVEYRRMPWSGPAFELKSSTPPQQPKVQTANTAQPTAGMAANAKLLDKDWVDVSPWNPLSSEFTRPYVHFFANGTYQLGQDGKPNGALQRYRWIDSRHIDLGSGNIEVAALTDGVLQLKLPNGRMQVFKTNVTSAAQGMQRNDTIERNRPVAISFQANSADLPYIRAFMDCARGENINIQKFGPVIRRGTSLVAKLTIRYMRRALSPIDLPTPEIRDLEALYEKAEDGNLYLTRFSGWDANKSCSSVVK